ncbi:MAG: DUF5678 domain-containing protein [Blastocatellia bacterium]
MSQMTYDQLAVAVIELPLSEQRRLLAQMSSRLEKNGSAETKSSAEQATATEDEQQASICQSQLWLQANQEIYRGEWIVLKGDELIGHSKDGVALARRVRSQGVKSPFIVFIPEEDLPWAGF